LVLSHHCLAGLIKKHENFSQAVMIAVLWAEILILTLPGTKQECYPPLGSLANIIDLNSN